MRLLNEEQTMIRDMAAGFLDEKAPVDALRTQRDAGGGFDAALLKDMAEMGWFGMLLGEDAGGVDMGAQAAGLVAEEMGRRLSASPFLSSGVMAATTLRATSETSWAAKVAVGHAVVAMGIDERIRHRPNAIETRAEKSGNGFVLNGAKKFVSDGAGADRIIVTAGTDDGLALFLIDPGLDGVDTRALKTVDNRNAADLSFSGVQLDGAALLAIGSAAQDALDSALRVGRSVASAELIGVSKEVAGRTTAYLKERKQFGLTLASFQALQHRAADLYTQIQTTDAVVAAALQAIDDGAEDAELLSRVAKAKAGKTASLAVREALQMHGGIGMTDELDIGLFMKKARACAEYLGDGECHGEWLLQQRGL
ncbi:acyl-CoA dehydrogenase [Shimia gijangensis]|uniref:Acyl-CoA dehydrogenase n=1 Tax=Shimia gijangensis TaxID=1470563 RepID=A0A1M6MEB2_9RHOB|nr:acyl-CoA dehydrogenase [Shimia gijangensis]SHJ81774.1 acyl-CoA dehydrogenase [Shimia gijangensis]